jgi:hypothetical protein
MRTHTRDRQKDSGRLTPAQIHELLRVERRRSIVDLLDSRGALTREQLTDAMTTLEFGEWADDDDRERVESLLYHCHLPKLDEAGVIDREGEAITLTERAAPVIHYLRVGPERVMPRERAVGESRG